MVQNMTKLRVILFLSRMNCDVMVS